MDFLDLGHKACGAALGQSRETWQIASQISKYSIKPGLNPEQIWPNC